MGFWSQLFGGVAGPPDLRAQAIESDRLIGNSLPICPNCDVAIDKMPGRKKKCPACGEYMYVRTRPSDRVKILVTEAGAEQVDDLWRIEDGSYDSHHQAKAADQAESDRQRAMIERQGFVPSETDVRWAVLTNRSLEQAGDNDWGLYRNTRFEMAESLRKEKRLEDALSMYFEVCFLDSNGPSNRGGLSDPQLLEEFPAFNRDMAFVAPGIVHRIERIATERSMAQDDLRAAYLERAYKIDAAMHLPTGPEVGWADLLAAMGNER